MSEVVIQKVETGGYAVFQRNMGGRFVELKVEHLISYMILVDGQRKDNALSLEMARKRARKLAQSTKPKIKYRRFVR